MAFVGSIDQGTSSTRFMIFDFCGAAVATSQLEHTQFYPSPGFVEHDPLQIWENTKTCIQTALEKSNLQGKDISAIGITNQRETTVIWNRMTGEPYHNAIVWNDTRTQGICDRISQLHKDLVHKKTGLPIATYFSASKILYLLDAIPGLRSDAEKGYALFGTIDSWLIWQLSGGKVHATDVTNASRTLLMNLASLTWDDELLAIFNIPRKMLPEIKSSSEVYGVVRPEIGSLAGVKIAGVLGDQQAALVGQTCFNVGETKATYGTGAFLLMNTGPRIILSNHGLLTTVGYKLGPTSPVVYCLEGSVAYCGSLIQWLRDNLGVISGVAESEALASSVEDNGGVYFVPAFAGLFAPYWRPDARGLICGLTAYNTKAHIARAALEAAGFQTKEIIDAMREDASLPLPFLRVDGGMTLNNLAMQFQSDLLATPLASPRVTETTALGAAFAAGLAVGVWRSTDELSRSWQAARTWQPSMSEQTRLRLAQHWKKAVSRSLGWLEQDIPAASAATSAATGTTLSAASAVTASSSSATLSAVSPESLPEETQSSSQTPYDSRAAVAEPVAAALSTSGGEGRLLSLVTVGCFGVGVGVLVGLWARRTR